MADLSFITSVTPVSLLPRRFIPTFSKLLLSLHWDSSVLARLREGRRWNRVSIRISGKDIFLFSKACRSAVVPTKPSVQWIRGAVFSGVNRRGLEADRS
jgi:hypothetical protein